MYLTKGDNNGNWLISEGFSNIGRHYWTSTTDPDNPNRVFGVPMTWGLDTATEWKTVSPSLAGRWGFMPNTMWPVRGGTPDIDAAALDIGNVPAGSVGNGTVTVNNNGESGLSITGISLAAGTNFNVTFIKRLHVHPFLDRRDNIVAIKSCHEGIWKHANIGFFGYSLRQLSGTFKKRHF